MPYARFEMTTSWAIAALKYRALSAHAATPIIARLFGSPMGRRPDISIRHYFIIGARTRRTGAQETFREQLAAAITLIDCSKFLTALVNTPQHHTYRCHA